MKNLVILIIVCCASISSVLSQKITPGEATIVGKNFIFNRLQNQKSVSIENIQAADIETRGEKTLFYIINFDEYGFVGVSAHKNVKPVLFYRLHENTNESFAPPAFEMWMDFYANQIQYMVDNKIKPRQSVLEEWVKLSDLKKLKPFDGKEVQPMLISTWNQGNFYNDMCPEDSNGPGGNALTGCVATAMGQLLYYHKFPETGTGSYSYEHPTYGTQYVDYENTTYHWDAMQNNLTDNNLSVAQLLYHLGVAVDMDYGPYGSGMWNHSAAFALRTYFKCSPETEYVFRDETTLDWDSIVITNLDANKPLYYAGWDPDDSLSGHAFVCDGYQSGEYYHFNWGWGGSYDGYFYTDNLTPGGSNFNFAQELIKDIYPDTALYVYPEGCSEEIISYKKGTINDGSQSHNYEPNQNCIYYIQPNCGRYIDFVFDRFSLASGDSLYVYSSELIPDSLVAVFSMENPPLLSTDAEPTQIHIESGTAVLNFKTDDAEESTGWDISFGTGYCDQEKIVTAQSGTISDGSDSCDYNNSEYCKWIIEPQGADSIFIDFTEFDLAENTNDHILIHYDTVSAATIVGNFFYMNIPDEITIPSGKAIIQFSTSSTESAGGWEFDYTTSNTGISGIVNALQFQIFPNPFTDVLKIQVTSEYSEKICIELKDASGRTLITKSTNIDPGKNIVLLDNTNKKLAAGIYILTLQSNHYSFAKTIIKKDN